MTNRPISSFILPFLIVAAIFTAGCGTGRERVVEKTFPNGFKVVLKENHASPMITSLILVKAGSKFEDDSTNGFTHFLEHLNFDGTKTKSRVDITEGIKNHGGYINAFTRKDATTYMILMPAEFIEYGLDVQSDQLFGSIFPDDEYAKEKKVVIEEIRMNNDDIKYKVELFTDSVLYAGTPYERPVLGSEQTITNVKKQAVVDYYRSQYTPDKMLAVAIGDFSPDSMLALYEKYFGDKKRGPAGSQIEFEYKFPALDSIFTRHENTKSTFLNIAFPAPRYSDPDYYAFAMIATILDAAETSPLYQALKSGEKPLVQSLSVYLDMRKEFTNLIISVQTDDPARIDEIIENIKKTLTGLARHPVDEEMLQGFIVRTKVDEYLLEERLHYWGIMKAAELAVGGYEFVDNYVDNISRVTPNDIQTAADKYFSDMKFVAAAVLPEA